MEHLNLELIAQNCGLYNFENEDEVVNNIQALENVYEQDDLVLIYNYLLCECKTPKILSEIIRCTDKIRNKLMLPMLLNILSGNISYDENNKDDFINVRVMCAKAIANLKDTSAVNILLQCLNSKRENYKVRFACADALGKIGDKYAVAPLIEVVKDEDEKSLYIRESAASALGMIGDISAIEPLVNILETKNGLINKFTFLKERILEALGKLKIGDNEKVFDAVKKSLLDESPQIRINAIEAIMDSENERAYETIKPCLKDSDDEVKRNALIALYNIAGREVLDEVIQSPEYSDFLKTEAVSLINEYENEQDNFYE